MKPIFSMVLFLFCLGFSASSYAELSESDKAIVVNEILNGNSKIIDRLEFSSKNDELEVRKCIPTGNHGCFKDEDCCSHNCAPFTGNVYPGPECLKSK
jgi:hypothetical protein